MKNSTFNKFLLDNKSKIDTIAEQNPVVSKDDEWVSETDWDNSHKEVLDARER